MRWVVLGSAYAILWFLALLIMLPIGIGSGGEDAPTDFEAGDPGAPHNPRFGLKLLIATAAAGFIWAMFYALVLMKVVDV